MKQNPTLYQKIYSDPIHEGFIDNLEQELLKHSELLGEEHGLSNKPVLENEYRAYTFNQVEATVQAGIDHNQQFHLPICGMVMANKIELAAKEKIAELKAELSDNKYKLSHLESDKKALESGILKTFFKRIELFIVSVFGIVEGYFINEALKGSSLPRLTAFITSLGLAVGISVSLHLAAGYIRKADTPWKRKIRYRIVLFIGFVVAAILGSTRANLYNSVVSLIPGNTSEIKVVSTDSVSGLLITIVSFVLFLIALAFAVKYWRSDEEIKREQAYNQKCAEIEKLKDEMRKKSEKISIIEQEKNDEVALALARYEYALSCEHRLIAIARKAIEVYKEKNLRFRQDKMCPEFFSNPPKFNFILFFDHLKKN